MEQPKLSRKDVLSTLAPLRMIVLGGLLYVLDLDVRGLLGLGPSLPRVRLDILNDAVGAVLVTIGVWRLGKLRVHNPWNNHYGNCMKFVKGIALLTVAEAAIGHFVFPHPLVLGTALAVLGMMQAAAVLLFCACLHWAIKAALLARARAAWDVATVALVALMVVPTFLVHFSEFWNLLAIQAETTPTWQAGPRSMFALALPLFVMYWATRRLEAEAKTADLDAG